MRSESKRAVAWLVASLAAFTGLAAPAIASVDPEPPAIDSIERERAMVSAAELSAAFRHAAEVIEPSVAHIIIERNNRRGFRQQVGVGSGVIVDARGYVLTNNHVIEAGQTIKVRLADGREVDGELVGAFSETDLAVLKIDADRLTPARFGDSEALGVGEWVIAVGSPFGFEQTVTAGIISAKGRGSIDPQTMDEAPMRFQEFLQTDAAINPGNSGGPLVDLDGRIVGINTAIASRGGGSNGLGFAIPSDIAQTVMRRIIDTGRVDRGWLGITMDPVDPTVALSLGIAGGVRVVTVLPDSPAADAGLEDGDIIVSLGGRSTENVTRLSNAIMLADPGRATTIEYIREDAKRTATAVLGDRDTAQALVSGGARLDKTGLILVPESLNATRRGVVVAEVPGYRVTDVLPDTPAARSGFEPGDFIYEVSGRAFDTVRELSSYLETAELSEPMRIGVIRGTQRGAIYLRKD